MDFEQNDAPEGPGGMWTNGGGHDDYGGYEIPLPLLVYNSMKAEKGEPILPLDHPVIVRGMEKINKLMEAGGSGFTPLGDSLMGGVRFAANTSAGGTISDAGNGGAPNTAAAPEKDYTVGGGRPAGSGNAGQDTPSRGNAPLPPHLQWANDPEMLSNYLAIFNKNNPLNPTNASEGVRKVFGDMQPPSVNYGPPTGVNNDVANYWFSYEGYPGQYIYNKVSVESKGKPGAYNNSSDAAGLAQVTPIAAKDVGFNFMKPNPNYDPNNKLKEPEYILYDKGAWRKAMGDPNFASMLGAMVARKTFNQAHGDPFRAEAGYVNGFGTLARKEKLGQPWPNQEYLREMFPGQWKGR